jgi:hypothetical protein
VSDHRRKGHAYGLLLGFVVVLLFGLAGLAASIGLDEDGASEAVFYVAGVVFLALGIAAWRDLREWSSGR